MTTTGLRGNHEFGCISEDEPFVRACADYFEGLWDAAGEDLTASQLDEWDAEVNAYLDGGGRPSWRTDLPDHGARAREVEDDRSGAPLAAPGWPAESGQAFVKFFGEGLNRVPWSFDVLEEVRRSGCHWACTYPASRRPRAVREGDALFVGRLVEDPNDTLIFGRAIGRKHRPGHDEATPAEIEARRWKAKWSNYIRVHHAEFVAGPMQNGIRLSELMHVLGSEAFASTQYNARVGNGRNVNPRKAFMRQPSVRLSAGGAAWLTEHLERAFDAHGRIPNTDLEALDWPAPD